MFFKAKLINVNPEIRRKDTIELITTVDVDSGGTTVSDIRYNM